MAASSGPWKKISRNNLFVKFWGRGPPSAPFGSPQQFGRSSAIEESLWEKLGKFLGGGRSPRQNPPAACGRSGPFALSVAAVAPSGKIYWKKELGEICLRRGTPPPSSTPGRPAAAVAPSGYALRGMPTLMPEGPSGMAIERSGRIHTHTETHTHKVELFLYMPICVQGRSQTAGRGVMRECPPPHREKGIKL